MRFRCASLDKKTSLILIATAIALAALGGTFGTTLVLVASKDRSYLRSIKSSEQSFVSYASNMFLTLINAADFASTELGGAVLGTIGGEEQDDWPTKIDCFDFLSQKLVNRINRTGAVFLAPDRFVTQYYPSGSFVNVTAVADIGNDVFPHYYNYSLPSIVGVTLNAGGHWYVARVYGVYSGGEPGSVLWGLSGCFVNLTSFPASTLDNEAIKRDMHFMLTAVLADETIQLIVASNDFDENTPIDTLRRFFNSGQSDVIHTGIENTKLVLVVKSNKSRQRVTSTHKVVVLLIEALGILFVWIIILAFIMWKLKTYEGFTYAPKSTPFAMLKIGCPNADQLWSLASEEMSEATEKLDGILESNMKRFHAYQIPQLQPYTTTYMFANVNDAVRMAIAVINEIDSRPIDTQLVLLLGKEGRVDVSCAVHWCTDAEAIVSEDEERVYYKGLDLVLGGRVWVLCPPRHILLSKSANLMFTPDANHYAEFYSSVYILGFSAAQDLFLVSSRTELRELFLDEVQSKHDSLASSFSSLEFIVGGSDAFTSNDHSERSIGSLITNKFVNKGMTDVMYVSNVRPPEEEEERQIILAKRASPKTVERTGSLDFDEGSDGSFERCLVKSGTHSFRGFDSSSAQSQGLNPLSTMPEPNPSLSHDSSIIRNVKNGKLRISNLPVWTYKSLREIFERHPLARNLDFASVFMIITVFYTAHELLFQPLSVQERENISRCWAAAFGVPQERLAEYIAVHCSLRFIQQHKDMVEMVGGEQT